MKNLERGIIPLYYQIKEILRADIENGKLPPHGCIPSERELCETYDVSRATVKQAVMDLVKEGLLYRIQGKGTFVAEPKHVQGLSTVSSFTQDMLKRGLQPSAKVLELKIVGAPRTVGKQLQLDQGQQVVKIKRIRYADGETALIETSHLPASRFKDLIDQDLKGSLYELLTRKYGVYLSWAEETFEPVLTDPFESETFDLPEGSPALLVCRTSYDRDAEPVEYVKSVIRGDKCKLLVRLSSRSG